MAMPGGDYFAQMLRTRLSATHECLKGACIDSAARQRVARRVPQHVGVDRECEAGGLAKPFYELLSAIDGSHYVNV
jgi:hypothetical protein